MGTLNQLLRTIYKKPKSQKAIKNKKVVLTPVVVVDVSQRFKQNYKVKEFGCWEWFGTLDRYGYGVFKNGRKSIKAHRYSYELHYGNFDKKLHVLHHCDNPRCVNPDHLFLGTNRDNVADRTAKKREGDTSRRLTAKEKECIKMALQDGQTVNHLAVEYKVHISTIKRLKAAIQSV